MMENFNEVAQRILQKKYTIQYLPSKLYDLKDTAFLYYRERKLKSDYIIDFVHMLITKYYFTKRINSFVLSSKVLKRRYGADYNLYVDYLVEKGIIHLTKQYILGVKSRTYALNSNLVNEKMLRIKNFNKTLLKKIKNNIIDVGTDDMPTSIIDETVKAKLINDLHYVDIDTDQSLLFMYELYDLTTTDNDLYNKCFYSIESINNGSFYYLFDSYGRMHTNVTTLKSEIRKACLRIDKEETSELDIKNSHPLFLAKLLHNTNSNWVDKDELKHYTNLVKSGNFYKYMTNVLSAKSKRDVKEMIYKVFYGINLDDEYNIKFKKVFPTIHNFITIYKKDKKSYKELSYTLQKMESDFVFNKLIKRIMNTNESIKIVTVHDSIIFQTKYMEFVYAIYNDLFDEEFNI